MTETPRRVFIGGGGDGLAAREVLRHRSVEEVVLVDLDRRVTELGKSYAPLRELNEGSLSDPRMRVVNQDAMQYLRETRDELFDVMLLDFPDPSTYAVGKLYSESFYKHVLARLKPDGAVVVQASSPLLARRTFWCTVKTLESVGFETQPYHALVPSFGEWGFVLAKRSVFAAPSDTHPAGKMQFLSLDAQHLQAMFSFPEDMSRVETRSNLLSTQQLVQYYLAEWSRVN